MYGADIVVILRLGGKDVGRVLLCYDSVYDLPSGKSPLQVHRLTSLARARHSLTALARRLRKLRDFCQANSTFEGCWFSVLFGRLMGMVNVPSKILFSGTPFVSKA